eukprot:scaffold2313_cov100-Isochrysis_galbana.AAC.4
MTMPRGRMWPSGSLASPHHMPLDTARPAHSRPRIASCTTFPRYCRFCASCRVRRRIRCSRRATSCWL